jgi:spermidine/putrescine-binding protein
LDLKRIPSYNGLSEGFRKLKVARKDNTVYGVPWAFGPNPLIYDTTKVKGAPDSWGALWDKKYRSKLSLQDDIATLYMVAQYLGMDDAKDPSHLYNLSDADLAKVKAKMLELRPNVRKYWVTAGAGGSQPRPVCQRVADLLECHLPQYPHGHARGRTLGVYPESG